MDRSITFGPGTRMLTLIAAALALAGAGPARAQAPINGCADTDAGTLANCVYHSPGGNYTPGVVDVYLEDPGRGNHPVPIRVRYPVGATGARPVVIWNHGGGTTVRLAAASNQAGFTVTNGQQGSVRRSESFARAGYVVIHIGRMQPTDLSPAQLADCGKAGVIAAGVVNPDNTALNACRTWIGWHIYGPQNVAFVANMLQHYRVGMLPGFEGTLDREKIVVGGWSGGTESALNIAGAYQKWTSAAGSVTLQPVVVPGVVAFFTDSPRGTAWADYSSGFQEDSPWGIDSRPFLFNTARDDRTSSEGVVVSRTAHFFGAAKGGKAMSYAWTPDNGNGGPNHGTMDINDTVDEATGETANGCNNALREAHCAALETLGVAFLDAAVRRLTVALEWMASGNFKVLTRDRIELHLR